jgi:hypothetical protein
VRVLSPGAISPSGLIHEPISATTVVTPLTADGRIGAIYRDSLAKTLECNGNLANKHNDVAGEKPERCHLCRKREAAGCVSRKMLANGVYRHPGGDLAIDTLAREGVRAGYRLERPPDELGNTRNVKCPVAVHSSARELPPNPFRQHGLGIGKPRVVLPTPRDFKSFRGNQAPGSRMPRR